MATKNETKPRKRRSLEERLADAQAKEDQARAAAQKKVDQAKARTQKARALVNNQKRKQRTRRHIIGGSICETHAQMHPDSEFAKTYRELIDKHVERPEDRKLFDL